MELLQKFKVEIVTPERISFSGEVEMVVIPGGDGEFGVLFGHIPLVSSITTGFISIYEKGSVIEKFFVADGFVEVTSEGTTILVDRAFPMMKVKVNDLEKIILELKKKQNFDLKDFDNYLIEKDIEFYTKLIEVIQDK